MAECVKDPDLPQECVTLRKMFFECKRSQLGMVEHPAVPAVQPSLCRSRRDTQPRCVCRTRVHGIEGVRTPTDRRMPLRRAYAAACAPCSYPSGARTPNQLHPLLANFGIHGSTLLCPLARSHLCSRSYSPTIRPDMLNRCLHIPQPFPAGSARTPPPSASPRPLHRLPPRDTPRTRTAPHAPSARPGSSQPPTRGRPLPPLSRAPLLSRRRYPLHPRSGQTPAGNASRAVTPRPAADVPRRMRLPRLPQAPAARAVKDGACPISTG